MLPYSFIGDGTYTSNGTSQNIALNDQPTFFQVTDTTNWGAASTAVAQMQSSWNSALANGAYLQTGQISASAGSNYMYGAQGTAGGFTFINSASPPTFAKVAITNVNASTLVVLTANTGSLAVGSYVRLINVAGGLQLSGSNIYQVTAVSANTSFTLGYVASAVSAGLSLATIGATSGFYQQVYPGQFYPTTLPIMYITRASQAVVYFARQNPYTPGELLDFQIPSSYGSGAWVGLNALTGQPGGAARVLSVTNSSTVSSVTLNLNTSGIASAFSLPTSGSFISGNSPAVIMPAGSGVVPLNGSATVPQSPPGTNLQDTFDNLNQYYMNLGSNVVGASSAVMYWQAWKSDYSTLSNA